MLHLTHHLTDAERLQLAQANRLLTAITDAHCHSCECCLCEARALTDVQDEEAYHVEYVPAETGEN